ncbi:hypothetical protein HCN51_18430 [Nonomuraea sp. FMUSA5-5]|uniref:Uncharacterized protein n=1 Tax=Nonomuraea composti TaxID=2720023 RepID=A0ABX1B8C9_9ACTN|nr:hypothetical protein [Nonomuraea sp. FMUSA5-5]NJP91413.1 hypothetical protein [Nonomuraea sp. FMUSA5-5]
MQRDIERGAPRHKERPQSSAAFSSPDHPSVPADELRRLLSDLEEQHQRERDAFRQGYLLGFTAGEETGYGRAENDMAVYWAAIARKVRATADMPSYRELELVRWDGPRERFRQARPGDRPRRHERGVA